MRSERLSLDTRRRLTDLAGRLTRLPAGVRCTSRVIGGVGGTWVEPATAAPGHCLLYLHGGGYVLGSPMSHRNLVARLVDATGVAAFVPRYRLAPEHPAPAALDDARAAYLALGEYGYRSDQIALIGDSAGGGLALALAMDLRDSGHGGPGVVAMICPWLDLAADRAGHSGDEVLTTEALAGWAAACAPDPALRSHPTVSPINGRIEGLPPMVVHAAGRDPLAADARMLTALASDAGLTIESREYPDLWHDFHACAGFLAEADEAIGHLAAAVGRHLGTPATPEVLVIGAGMSGLCMGAKLKAAGIDSFAILEKGSDLGGTWRDNTYPGLSCDVPSRFYSYSFLPNPDWSTSFAGGAEIQRYFKAAADELEVGPHIELETEVAEARWDGGRWEVRTTDGVVRHADVVVTATGVLHHPRYPEIPGMDTYAGAMFHSARWDHTVPLEGRRVAVVGTGSTGVQIVSALAGKVEQLYVVQRSAQWVVAIPNRRYSRMTRALMRRVPALNRIAYHGYRIVLAEVFSRALTKPGLTRRLLAGACRRSLRQIRDPELRRRMTPDHEPMCRRLIMSPGYYQAMQRDDVELVTEGIERIEPEGIRLGDGRLLAVDVIVLATGFDAHAYVRPITVVGEDGLTLEQARKGGPRAYRTVALPGFPNLFMLMGPHSPIGNFSLIAVAEAQADYVMAWIERLRRGAVHHAAPSASATDAYNAEMRAAMPNTIWTTGCTSWYIGEDGLPELWPWSPGRHRAMLREDHVEEWHVATEPARAVSAAHT
jgi:cation diffusion facilitator CzcD-associated flavoprotein CzcO/acetyl esterase/lipase